MKKVTQSWIGHLSTTEDQDAFMLTVMRCINQSQTMLGAGDLNQQISSKSSECLKKIEENWIGGFPSQEDPDAFDLAHRRCIDEPLTPAPISSSLFDKRDECSIPYDHYASLAYYRLTIYIHAKNLDESRWNSHLIRDGLLACVSGAVEMVP